MVKGKWIPLWVVPLVILFATGTVWLRLYVIRTTYRIHEIETEISRTRKEKDKTQLKLSALRSPRRLDLVARSKFGLFPPKMEQFIRLESQDAHSKPF